MRALNKDMSVNSIYTNLTRAFDTVNIYLLFRILKGYGMNELIAVLPGVGQGTHLGPVLFLIYMILMYLL